MKALAYHGPGQKAWEGVPNPSIRKPTDIIVKIETTTICGTDLHILKGAVPAVEDGRIFGHEGVGTITEIGSAVASLTIGPRNHFLHLRVRAWARDVPASPTWPGSPVLAGKTHLRAGY